MSSEPASSAVVLPGIETTAPADMKNQPMIVAKKEKKYLADFLSSVPKIRSPLMLTEKRIALHKEVRNTCMRANSLCRLMHNIIVSGNTDQRGPMVARKLLSILDGIDTIIDPKLINLMEIEVRTFSWRLNLKFTKSKIVLIRKLKALVAFYKAREEAAAAFADQQEPLDVSQET